LDQAAIPQEAIIVVPPNWWVVSLASDERRKRSVKKLVERQAGGADVNAQLRAELRQELDGLTSAAMQRGGRLYAVSLMQNEEGDPLAATVLVSREIVELETIRVRLALGDVETVEAEGEYGPVYRTIKTEPGPELWGAQDIEQLIVNYWLEPPDGLGVYRATFTTPHLELEEGMIALFDAMVESVTVLGAE